MTTLSSPSPPGTEIKITTANFGAIKRSIRDELLQFGEIGKEILTGARIPLVMPEKYIDVAAQTSLYRVDPKGNLTAEGLEDFKYDRNLATARKQKRDADSEKAIHYLVNKLSEPSKTILETKQGPAGYVAARNNYDVFRVWQLIEETHLGSHSRRAQQVNFINFITMIQGAMSHEAFLAAFHDAYELAIAAYGVEIGGVLYFRGEEIAKCVYLNGLQMPFFAHQKDRAMEDLAKATLQELQAYMQTSSLERAPINSGTAESYAPAGLAAPTLSSDNRSAKPKPGSLGTYIKGHCYYCWTKGYRTDKHEDDDCTFKFQAERAALKKAKDASGKAPEPKSVDPSALMAAMSFRDSFTSGDLWQKYVESSELLGLTVDEDGYYRDTL